MAGKDEDLDDLLDDALNDFDKLEVSHSAIKTDGPESSSSQQSQTSSSSSSASANGPFAASGGGQSSSAGSDVPSEEQLTKEFASKMRELLKDVSDDPSLLALLDEMVPDGNKASSSTSSSTDGASASSSATNTGAKPMDEDELQKKINEALNALQENADKASGGAGGLPDMDKLFEEFENNPEMSQMMDTMLKQMMSKDVLYEPLKELRDVFPAWMDKNRSTLDTAELARHESQLEILNQIVATYESGGAGSMEKVTTLMQQMQETGPFPTDLLKEMSPEGMQWGEDGMPILPTDGVDPKNCIVM